MKLPEAKNVVIPVKINDKDRARILKEMVKVREKIGLKELELEELKDVHKAVEKEMKDDISDLDTEFEAKMTTAKTGVEQREVKCYERKNFQKQPPMREFIDMDKKTVLYEERLEEIEFQVKTGEWVLLNPDKQKESTDG